MARNGRKNESDGFSELFGLLRYGRPEWGSKPLQYPRARLKQVQKNLSSILPQILQGLQGVGGLLSRTQFEGEPEHQDIQSIGRLIAVTTNLIETALTFKEEAQDAFESTVTSHESKRLRKTKKN